MIEITMVDFFLLVWAGVATSMWLSAREDNKNSKRFIKAMLENDDLRDTVVADFKTFKEKANAN